MDLHDFGGSGSGFSVGGEEFEDMVDGSSGTSKKIPGLQPAANLFTPSGWMAQARTRTMGVVTTRYFVRLLSNILGKAKILRMG